MKNQKQPQAIIRIMLFLLFLFPLTGYSQNTLTLQNNTDHDVYAAYAIFVQSENCWVSIGYYKVTKYGNFTIDLGNYRGNAYVHGEHQGLVKNLSWGSGFWMCVDDHDAFRIICPDKINCKTKKEFSQMAINKGDNKFLFNP